MHQRQPGSGTAAASRFTLIELLVVITIILILAAVLLPALTQAKHQVFKAQCMSNLKQFGLAIVMYRGDNAKEDADDAMPTWLSWLHPQYIDSPRSYVCPEDDSSGHDGSRPCGTGDIVQEPIDPSLEDDNRKWYKSFEETDDTAFNPKSGDIVHLRNTLITHCSYMYEFAGAKLDKWGTGVCAPAGETWNQRKINQLAKGYGRCPISAHYCMDGTIGTPPTPCPTCQGARPWDPYLFPVARCFYHWSPLWGAKGLVLNTAYDGGVFRSKDQWELGVFD